MKKIFGIILVVLFFYSIQCLAEDRNFEIKAKKFSYTPNIIQVKKGDLVRIQLISEDVHHGLSIDGYNLNVSAVPGKDGTINFVANKTGRFSFRCSVTCGEYHPYMVGYLIVESNTRYFIFVLLTIIIGLLSLFFSIKKKKEGKIDNGKLFGIIDLNWRFELTRFKFIRRLFKSRWFPLLVILFNLFIFVIVLIAGFVGGYSAGNYNFGIMIVWILWWVLLMFLLVPVFSRSWCMMCPFPIFSDWFQRKGLFRVNQGRCGGLGLKWPTSLKNMWIMNIGFLITTYFSGFFTVRPLATFILLGGIILLAFLIGMIFEKRTFCLYICPVSGFQGLYSQFGMAEVRCKDIEICKKHTPKTCYVGNENGYGCPWNLTPFNFTKNTYCGMCLECFKTCPNDNMAFNLRSPGIDLLVDTPREPKRLDEAWKAFIMLGIAIVFFLSFQGPWGILKDMVRGATLNGYLLFIVSHTIFSLLIIPGIFFIVAFLSKLISGDNEVSLKKIFTNFSYTLIPFGLGVWIAFSVGIILPNGSYILHILSDPFAWGWNLFGTAKFLWTPILTGAIGFVQGLVLTVFYIFSIVYGFRIAKQTFKDEIKAVKGWIPILVFLSLINIIFLKLYLG